ncbi:MAG: HI0074 family nucleotidyltransferase substrate-binding subunit [Lachnospiraceae bacterium]|nr:nucleotidyltransferase substrate binding protein [Lachnospiraceae bacterium]MEE1015513.1 HI0074 family nucleotidyltransferase substrate-binding subunit [Lachnospiraceae bacterium]
MKKYDNFCNALRNLKDIFNYTEPFGNVELTGMVGLFEVCFEQSWKAMKELLEKSGYDSAQTGSPRHIIKTAYQASMINDEDTWLEALVSRNNVAHAYNKDVALDIIYATKEKYYEMFCELKQSLESNWL